jgi:putative FmdB family regulatory protein
MPVYEYRCTACSSEFEYEHRMSERKTVCEKCSGELERLISRTSFSFKGGGWYKDLYASTKPAADGAASGDSGGAESGDKAAATSGDKAGGDKASGDKASGDKAGSGKAGSDKAGGDKAGGGKAGGGSSSSGSAPAASGMGTGPSSVAASS